MKQFLGGMFGGGLVGQGVLMVLGAPLNGFTLAGLGLIFISYVTTKEPRP